MIKPRIDYAFAPPRVCITLSCLQAIRGYVAACPAEINGLGLVERKGNDFFTKEVLILPQVVTGASAVTDEKAFHQFLYERAKSSDSQLRIGLQWHSHVCMSARFSPVDLRLIDQYNVDWMISLVVNKYGEYQCRLDLYKPFRLGLDVPLYLELPKFSVDAFARISEEVSQKVCIERREPHIVCAHEYPHLPLRESAIFPLPSLAGDGSGLGVSNILGEEHASP